MTLKGFIDNVVNTIRLILKRPLSIRDFLSINLSINQKKIKKMEKTYRKAFDEEGHEFTEKSERSNNLLGIIATIVAGILLVLLITFVVKSYYKEKFQQEKEKIETTNPTPAPVRTRTIVKEVPREVPREEEPTPIVINLPPDAPAPVAVAPAPEKGNSFDDFIKSVKKLVE